MIDFEAHQFRMQLILIVFNCLIRYKSFRFRIGIAKRCDNWRAKCNHSTFSGKHKAERNAKPTNEIIKLRKNNIKWTAKSIWRIATEELMECLWLYKLIGIFTARNKKKTL